MRNASPRIDPRGLGRLRRWLDRFWGEALDAFRRAIKASDEKRMPVLEDEGFVLWESSAILQHLASKKPKAGVWPSDAKHQADVLRWMSWELAHWDPACSILIEEPVKKIVFKTGPPDAAEIARGKRLFHELARILDSHLATRAFVTGEHPTLADFSLACWIPAGEMAHYPLANYGEIKRWYASMAALPGWQEVLPRRPR